MSSGFQLKPLRNIWVQKPVVTIVFSLLLRLQLEGMAWSIYRVTSLESHGGIVAELTEAANGSIRSNLEGETRRIPMITYN